MVCVPWLGVGRGGGVRGVLFTGGVGGGRGKGMVYPGGRVCKSGGGMCSGTVVSRAYRTAEGGERACNSHLPCTDGEMLVVTKNRK